MTKEIDSFLLIDSFEQQCVVLKFILQSPRLKDHVNTIGIDQPLSNNALYEHKCLQNTNKIFKHSGKCDDQQKFKYIIEDAMVYTLEGLTNNSHISTMISTPVKKPSARKSLCLFTNMLYVKKKTDTRQVRATKSNHNSFKAGTTPWALKPNKN